MEVISIPEVLKESLRVNRYAIVRIANLQLNSPDGVLSASIKGFNALFPL